MSEKKVNKKDTVTVFGTGASKFLPEGKESGKIHKVQAEKLIASGKATAKPGASKGSKKEADKKVEA
jgi:hypothetical protein